jgi:hypothetical protein
MKLKNLVILFVISLCLGLIVIQVEAEHLTGREIIDKSRALTRIEGMKSELEMRIINKSGQERVRKLKLISKENDRGVEKSLMYFLEPANVRGTGFLNIIAPGKEDEKYLYLPALGRPRRISSSERGGSFMGSDFSYEDISPNIDDYKYEFLNVKSLDDCEVYVVKAEPTSDKIKKDVGFTEKIIFIRKDNFVPIKVEYFNDKKKKTKVMIAEDIKKINEACWTVTRMQMKDLEKDSRTILIYNNINVSLKISDNYFTIRQLTRPRF